MWARSSWYHPTVDTRTQVAILVESAIPGTGSAAPNGVRAATKDLEAGQFLSTLALNRPLGNKAGFVVEAYGTGHATLSTSTTAGLYFRPPPLLRLAMTAGQAVSGPAIETKSNFIRVLDQSHTYRIRAVAHSVYIVKS